MIRIFRLERADGKLFPVLCEWYFRWLGEQNGESREEIAYTFAHSLETKRLPQTMVALADGCPAGMYQLAVADDLTVRPDLYPWLINAYVAEGYRGQGVFRALMESVPRYAAAAGIRKLYLYTEHAGLYERFGWEYIGEERTFRAKTPVVRLYRLNVGTAAGGDADRRDG